MSEVAKCTSKPIFLYSIPGRCGIGTSNDTAVRLYKKYPNICAMKEAGGKVDKVEDLHSKVDDNFTILSGDDGLTVDFMKNGAKGVISVASNIVPERMVELVDLMLAGNVEKAQAISDELAGFFHALFIEPNPVPAKTAMWLKGMTASPFVRLPLCAMQPENLAILKSEMGKAKI